MNFNGSYHFEKNIEDIWESLNNPEVLKKCINGCEEFIEKDKNNFLLKIKVKIGPINATFQGSLVLKNIKPPHNYTIEGIGNAGQLGGAKGKVNIALTEKNKLTYLNYEANTSINGKIAQLGSRLIDGTVKKNTNMFFENFNRFLHENKSNNNQTLTAKENDKKLISNEKLKKKYLYFLLIIFFIILFIMIKYE